MSAPFLQQDWQFILRALQFGWDSYNAVPITEEAISALGLFYVVPCADGGVQLEVHRDGYDIEIAIGPHGKITSVMISTMAERDKLLKEIEELEEKLESVGYFNPAPKD